MVKLTWKDHCDDIVLFPGSQWSPAPPGRRVQGSRWTWPSMSSSSSTSSSGLVSLFLDQNI